jgi:hypothetical protein
MGFNRVERTYYWILVVILIAAKIGIVAVLEFAPQMASALRYVDTPIAIVLALVVGGRFADAGWPRWLGITLVLLIMVVLPIVIIVASGPVPKTPNFLDSLPATIWISTVALFVLLVIAGVKPSAMVSVVEAPTRKEPTF